MQDLRTVREQKRLTQKDISSLTGLPQSHVSALEAGKYMPNLRTRKRIEMLMGTEIDWLATTSGDKDHITFKLLELLNLEADNVMERITHVKRVLHTIEQNLKILEQ